MKFNLGCTILGLIVAFQSIHLADGQNSNPDSAAAQEHRKTSEPYTGDLTIFDSPGRDERLQINRVMDILGITEDKAVADIGAGSGWFTVQAARRVGVGGVFMPSILIRNRFIMWKTAPGKSG